MKKIILPLLLVMATLFVNAQCVPGTMSLPMKGYIIPDSATNFMIGCAGQPYDQVIYIKAPKDTLFNGITATVDSFVVDANIIGLPPYLSITTVPAITPASPGNPKTNIDRLIIKGDSLACIRISGNIPAGTSGNNPLTIGVRAYLTVIVLPVDTNSSIGYYHINVMNPCWPAATSNPDKYNFEILSAVPNPTANATQITFKSNDQDTYEYKLVSQLGEAVISKTVKANNGLNYITIDAANLSSGMYMFTLSNGKNLVTQKIQVSK